MLCGVLTHFCILSLCFNQNWPQKGKTAPHWVGQDPARRWAGTKVRLRAATQRSAPQPLEPHFSALRAKLLTHLRSAAPYRPSTREGQVEEAVSVAAPRGDMDGSRSRVTDISESCSREWTCCGAREGTGLDLPWGTPLQWLIFPKCRALPNLTCRPCPLPVPRAPACPSQGLRKVP